MREKDGILGLAIFARIGWKNNHHQRVCISKRICKRAVHQSCEKKILLKCKKLKTSPKPWKLQKVKSSSELFIDDHQPIKSFPLGPWPESDVATDPPAGEPFKRFKKKTGFSYSYGYRRLAGFTTKMIWKRFGSSICSLQLERKTCSLMCFLGWSGYHFVEGKNHTNQKNLITNPEASRKT